MCKQDEILRLEKHRRCLLRVQTPPVFTVSFALVFGIAFLATIFKMAMTNTFVFEDAFALLAFAIGFLLFMGLTGITLLSKLLVNLIDFVLVLVKNTSEH